MIFYSEKNVYEAAKDRIRWIFEEFSDRKIVVSFSGGKDSTTILHLVKEVMDEKGITKIPVFFCDQELEAPHTIEYVREVMHRPWVKPYWIQSFFQEWNSSKGAWFNVWGVGEKWVREKEPNNPYTDIQYPKTRHFKEVLDSMLRYHFGDDYIAIGGVRIEESPARRLGLTQQKCYKDITWGKTCAKGALVLYPIWDWGCNDVWYYILSNNIKYCKLYNYYFTKRSLRDSRVSSFIHENSIQMLKEIKEVSPQFYLACLRRVENVNTTVQTYDMLLEYIKELPKYFSSWSEYIYYLAENIIEKEENKKKIIKGYEVCKKRWFRKFGTHQEGIELADSHIGLHTARAIVSEDFELSKLNNAEMKLVVYLKSNYGKIKEANKGNDEWVGE